MLGLLEGGDLQNQLTHKKVGGYALYVEVASLIPKSVEYKEDLNQMLELSGKVEPQGHQRRETGAVEQS